MLHKNTKNKLNILKKENKLKQVLWTFKNKCL